MLYLFKREHKWEFNLNARISDTTQQWFTVNTEHVSSWEVMSRTSTHTNHAFNNSPTLKAYWWSQSIRPLPCIPSPLSWPLCASSTSPSCTRSLLLPHSTCLPPLCIKAVFITRTKLHTVVGRLPVLLPSRAASHTHSHTHTHPKRHTWRAQPLVEHPTLEQWTKGGKTGSLL